MMTFKPVQKLEVYRTLTSGDKVHVGSLAQNRQSVYFQYTGDYLKHFANLSPFNLSFDASVQAAPKVPHWGVHGAFADALPDGWGLLLQDRIFRAHGILPTNLTTMDRLAFVGESALGALSFAPSSEYIERLERDIAFDDLGLHAQAIFDGQTEEVLNELAAMGSSGGARPKAQVYFSGEDYSRCWTQPNDTTDAWLVKFTSANLSLGHEEGICEAVYLTLAERAGLNPPEWQLLSAPERSGAKKWLALKRFDYIKDSSGKAGRMHLHSACGLLDADFRAPSLDYIDLIKATRILCKSPAAGQLQFKRAIFNLLACNHDDHSKNWAFLQDDQGAWQPAPFYDTTFSPNPFGEHATAYAGYGKRPSLKALQQLAESAGYSRWSIARDVILEMIEVVSEFQHLAASLGVSAQTTKLIAKQIEAVCNDTRGTLA